MKLKQPALRVDEAAEVARAHRRSGNTESECYALPQLQPFAREEEESAALTVVELLVAESEGRKHHRSTERSAELIPNQLRCLIGAAVVVHILPGARPPNAFSMRLEQRKAQSVAAAPGGYDDRRWARVLRRRRAGLHTNLAHRLESLEVRRTAEFPVGWIYA